MFQDKLQSVPTLFQQHLRVFCECAISYLKGDDLAMNIIFTDHYLERSIRLNLCWPNDSCFEVIRSLTNTFWPNDQVIGDTFWLVLNKTDEALIISKAAMFCVNYLCNPSSTRKDARRHLRLPEADRNYRKTRPWRWHQRRWCRGLARKVIVQNVLYNDIFRYSLTTYGRFFSKHDFQYSDIYPLQWLPWIHWNFRNYDNRATSFYQYCGFLEYLVILLPRAGRFLPLMHLCKTKVFVPMSMMFPDQSRKARLAIAAYLDRMEADIVVNDNEQMIP